jgi:hypothetical protein
MAYQNKKIPWLMIFAFLFVFGVGLFYAYYLSQNSYLDSELETVNREVAEVQNQLNDLRSSETVSAQRGITALDSIENSEVLWSDVLSILNVIVPPDLSAKQPIVTFSSYSGTKDGALTFNGTTIASTNVKKQLNDVADVIKVFEDNPAFENAFVPSVSKSVTEENETILSLILNVDYNPSASEEEEEEVAVPRP